MNRTLEFENSQNNNGPISTVDMENIQNNNAMDYIPNRNEINITIEPSPHSINRNLLIDANRDASTNYHPHHQHHDDMAMMEASTSATQHMVEQSMPTTASTSIATFDNFASCSSISSFEPYHQLNELNAYRQNDGILLDFAGTPPATASESLNNYLDLDDDDNNCNDDDDDDDENDENVESFPSIRKDDSAAIHHTLADDSEMCQRIGVSNVAHEPIRHHKIDAEFDRMDDDTISVEEALRALDFAISGGESILSDDPDDSSSDNDDADDNNHDDKHEESTNSVDMKLHAHEYHERDNDSETNDADVTVVANETYQQQQSKSKVDVDVDVSARMPDNTKYTGLIEIADAKDNLIVVINEVNETNDEPTCHSGDVAPHTEHSGRIYVRELATDLVDSVLEECTAKIAQMTARTPSTTNETDNAEPTKNESHATVTADDSIAEHNASTEVETATTTAVTVPVDSDATVAGAAVATFSAPTTSDATFDAINLDESLDETFVVGKLEASTPCHKTTDINRQRGTNRMGINLFQTLDEVNESALNVSDIEPLAKSEVNQFDAHIAYATFEMPHPSEQQLAETFVKSDDATFVAATSVTADETVTIEKMHDTFDIAAAAAPASDTKPRNDVPRMNPSIKIDKDEANSDDLTTLTPMNTPIELNYVGDSWDQFVSKSMNTKSSDLTMSKSDSATTVPAIAPPIDDDNDDGGGGDDDDSQRMTKLTASAISTATVSKNPWFLHGPQSNDTFDVNDTDYSNYDGINDDSESIDDNPELLSLTFDALRKQLAETLPHASGKLIYYIHTLASKQIDVEQKKTN